MVCFYAIRLPDFAYSHEGVRALLYDKHEGKMRVDEKDNSIISPLYN